MGTIKIQSNCGQKNDVFIVDKEGNERKVDTLNPPKGDYEKVQTVQEISVCSQYDPAYIKVQVTKDIIKTVTVSE